MMTKILIKHRFIILTLTLFVSQIWAILSYRHLAQDTAMLYFRIMMDSVFPFDNLRFFSSFIYIVPYFIYKFFHSFEITQLTVLSVGFSFLLFHLGCLFYCYKLALKNKTTELMLFPLINYSTGVFLSIYFVGSQINEVSALVWPLLFLVFCSEMKMSHVFLFLLITFFLGLSHETAILPLAAVWGVIFLIYRQSRLSKKIFYYLSFSILLSMLSCIIRVLVNDYPTAKGALFLPWSQILGDTSIWFFIFFILVFCSFVFSNSKSKALKYTAVLSVISIWPILNAHMILIGTIAYRMLTIYQTCLMIMLFFLVQQKDFRMSNLKSKSVFMICFFTVGFATYRDIVLTGAWNDRKFEILDLIHRNAKNPNACLVLEPHSPIPLFSENWPLFMTSILFQKKKEVSHFIINSTQAELCQIWKNEKKIPNYDTETAFSNFDFNSNGYFKIESEPSE